MKILLLRIISSLMQAYRFLCSLEMLILDVSGGPRGMMDPRNMDPRMMGMMGGPGGPMGGPGGPMGPGGFPPTSLQAQLEWQKMQQQFIHEKSKNGGGMVGGPGNLYVS